MTDESVEDAKRRKTSFPLSFHLKSGEDGTCHSGTLQKKFHRPSVTRGHWTLSWPFPLPSHPTTSLLSTSHLKTHPPLGLGDTPTTFDVLLDFPSTRNHYRISPTNT